MQVRNIFRASITDDDDDDDDGTHPSIHSSSLSTDDISRGFHFQKFHECTFTVTLLLFIFTLLYFILLLFILLYVPHQADLDGSVRPSGMNECQETDMSKDGREETGSSG